MTKKGKHEPEMEWNMAALFYWKLSKVMDYITNASLTFNLSEMFLGVQELYYAVAPFMNDEQCEDFEERLAQASNLLKKITPRNERRNITTNNEVYSALLKLRLDINRFMNKQGMLIPKIRVGKDFSVLLEGISPEEIKPPKSR